MTQIIAAHLQKKHQRTEETSPTGIGDLGLAERGQQLDRIILLIKVPIQYINYLDVIIFQYN